MLTHSVLKLALSNGVLQTKQRVMGQWVKGVTILDNITTHSVRPYFIYLHKVTVVT